MSLNDKAVADDLTRQGRWLLLGETAGFLGEGGKDILKHSSGLHAAKIRATLCQADMTCRQNCNEICY